MKKSSPWMFAAAISILFLVFTLWVVAREGFTGLFAAHEVNLWGSQVFIDLVIAAVTGLFLMAPRARRVGVGLAPYVGLTVLTGSIGLLALVARVLYLESRESAPDSERARALQTEAS